MYKWATQHDTDANDNMYACVTLHYTDVNTDEDGHTLENEHESGRRLCEYWSSIFQARVEGPKHHQYENILRYV